MTTSHLNVGLLTVPVVLRWSQKLMVLMNPKDEEEKQEEEEISRMQTDVTDEEMALRYEQADTDGSLCSGRNS